MSETAGGGRVAWVGAARRAPTAQVLDLDHLRRQCLDDDDLAAELLSRFRDEARAGAVRLAVSAAPSAAASGEVAHRLRGAALAVGAFAVARAAAAVEACGSGRPADADAASLARAIDRLRRAVARAAAEIDRLQGR